MLTLVIVFPETGVQFDYILYEVKNVCNI